MILLAKGCQSRLFPHSSSRCLVGTLSSLPNDAMILCLLLYFNTLESERVGFGMDRRSSAFVNNPTLPPAGEANDCC